MLNKAEDKRDQYEMISVSELVPKDHLLRKVDKVLDLNFVYELVEDKCCLDNGRPSIDPVILVKILLIQRLFGIKSMRQTIKEIETNVAYRWYLGFSFLDKVPHYGTFSKNYTRRFHDTDLFEQIFERILQIAIKNNLIDHSTLFIDSTHIKANANKNKYINRVVKKDTLHFQEELNNEINQQRLAQGKKPIKNKKKEEYKNKKVSTTDQEAGYYVKGEREKQFAYSLHSCVDKNGFIIDQHVTPGNVHDSTQLKPMVERLEAKNMLPITLAVDSGYKTPFNAHYLLEKSIVPAMPYTRPKGKPGIFKSKEFIYDEYYDSYICPNDEFLTFKRTMPTGHRLYKSDPTICKTCPLLNECTENRNYTREIRRHVWQDDLDIIEDLRFIDTIKKAYKLRSQTVERRFGDAKEQHGMRWTRYRGIKKVSMDTTLICAAMNLKKLAMWLVKEPQIA
ncbi:IS1182 family transposase [Mammaliicoccus sciuri]|uniref:IS1182 family transposase n=12 Tax=Staphylococcaceae TaxID=90964 RepID=UPI000D1F4979|nr:IS1182 family transposase [Mammaliicoccus sciuri]MEB6342397.1 IS1182 family transposase [Mammaliicoccus sciuri]MEB7414606.1 IS1182 family transposase [Mammaliicoccus sciuri]PTJ44619.1 IS1182 family transposase [Mammaliicoccus sciuri]RIN99379.1 IS1182 family transposase [Mammaliicoccus sciuri]